MIAEKVFAESVAKDIGNFLPEKYENAEFQWNSVNRSTGKSSGKKYKSDYLYGTIL